MRISEVCVVVLVVVSMWDLTEAQGKIGFPVCESLKSPRDHFGFSHPVVYSDVFQGQRHYQVIS